jgi:hypothetical protein
MILESEDKHDHEVTKMISGFLGADWEDSPTCCNLETPGKLAEHGIIWPQSGKSSMLE